MQREKTGFSRKDVQVQDGIKYQGDTVSVFSADDGYEELQPGDNFFDLFVGKFILTAGPIRQLLPENTHLDSIIVK